MWLSIDPLDGPGARLEGSHIGDHFFGGQPVKLGGFATRQLLQF